MAQLQRSAEEEAEQVEVAELGPGVAAAACAGVGAPAKRAKAGFCGSPRGSLPELVSRLASVLPMARTLPHLRALLAEQQQQQTQQQQQPQHERKFVASDTGALSAAADEQSATAAKRAKLASISLPGLDLVASEGDPVAIDTSESNYTLTACCTHCTVL